MLVYLLFVFIIIVWLNSEAQNVLSTEGHTATYETYKASNNCIQSVKKNVVNYSYFVR